MFQVSQIEVKWYYGFSDIPLNTVLLKGKQMLMSVINQIFSCCKKCNSSKINWSQIATASMHSSINLIDFTEQNVTMLIATT